MSALQESTVLFANLECTAQKKKNYHKKNQVLNIKLGVRCRRARVLVVFFDAKHHEKGSFRLTGFLQPSIKYFFFSLPPPSFFCM